VHWETYVSRLLVVRDRTQIGRGCTADQYPRLLLLQTSSNLLKPSIHNRHQTARFPHPQTRPSRPVPPFRTRHLGTTASPLRDMTEILPITVSDQWFVLGRDAAPTILEKIPSDRPKYPSVRTRRELSRAFRLPRKRLICILHSYAVSFVSVPAVLYKHLIDNGSDGIRG
jgi:hypothetical protein